MNAAPPGSSRRVLAAARRPLVTSRRWAEQLRGGRYYSEQAGIFIHHTGAEGDAPASLDLTPSAP